jgi:hypothetical protein
MSPQPNPVFLPVSNTPTLYGAQARDSLELSCVPLGEAAPGDIVGVFMEVLRRDEEDIYKVIGVSQFLIRMDDPLRNSKYSRRHFSMLSATQEANAALTAMRLTETLAINQRALAEELARLHPIRRDETYFETLFMPDFAIASYQLFNEYLLNFEEDEIGQSAVDESLRLLVPTIDSSHDAIELTSQLPAICDFVNDAFPVFINETEKLTLIPPDTGPLLGSGFCNSG